MVAENLKVTPDNVTK